MRFARIIYAKDGIFRLIGHLDTLGHLEKALRRMDIKFVTGSGYKRKIKFSASPALSLGISSQCEYIDVATADDCPREVIFRGAESHFPEGLTVQKVIVSTKKFPVPRGCIYEKAGEKITVTFGDKKKVAPPAVRVSFIY